MGGGPGISCRPARGRGRDGPYAPGVTGPATSDRVPSPAGLDARTTTTDQQLRIILQDILGLEPELVATFDDNTELFGALPELDSMAVATLLTEVEDSLSIIIDDDDIDGETFETYGTLLAFIEGKIAATR